MEAFATTDELELHLGRPLADPAAAEQALLMAAGAIRSYCRWDISLTTDAEFEAYGDGSHTLSLPTLCLLDVKKITVDLVDIGPPVRSADLMWTRKGQIHRTEGWCKDAVVNVIIDHGYDPVPDVIKLVNLDAASRQLTNPENLVSATTGEVSRTWQSASPTTTTLSALHQALLDNYRLFT